MGWSEQSSAFADGKKKRSEWTHHSEKRPQISSPYGANSSLCSHIMGSTYWLNSHAFYQAWLSYIVLSAIRKCVCVHEGVCVMHDFFCFVHMISNCEELLHDSLTEPSASKTSVKREVCELWVGVFVHSSSSIFVLFLSLFFFFFDTLHSWDQFSLFRSRICVNAGESICLIKILCLCKTAISHCCHSQGESTVILLRYYTDTSTPTIPPPTHTHMQKNKSCYNPVSELLNWPITGCLLLLLEKLEFALCDVK